MLRGQQSAPNSASDLNSALSSIAAQQQRNSHSLDHLSERLTASLQPKLGPSAVPPASPLYPAKPKESALETSTMPASVEGHSSSPLRFLFKQQALATQAEMEACVASMCRKAEQHSSARALDQEVRIRKARLSKWKVTVSTMAASKEKIAARSKLKEDEAQLATIEADVVKLKDAQMAELGAALEHSTGDAVLAADLQAKADKLEDVRVAARDAEVARSQVQKLLRIIENIDRDQALIASREAEATNAAAREEAQALSAQQQWRDIAQQRESNLKYMAKPLKAVTTSDLLSIIQQTVLAYTAETAAEMVMATWRESNLKVQRELELAREDNHARKEEAEADLADAQNRAHELQELAELLEAGRAADKAAAQAASNACADRRIVSRSRNIATR